MNDSKKNYIIKIIKKILIIGGGVFFIIGIFLIVQITKAKEQKIIDHFNSNRQQIVLSIEELIDSKKYQDAHYIIDKYSYIVNDGIFAQLKEKIEEKIEYEQEKNEREKRTKEILATLNKEEPFGFFDNSGNYVIFDKAKNFFDQPLWVKHYEDLHEELIELNPDNEKFKRKNNFWKKNMKEHEERRIRKLKFAKKQQEERIAKFGKPPDTEIWGFHGYEGPVMEYLKQRAHNPPSVSIVGCSKVGITSDGWIIFCEYRGQNAFGAMVHKKKAFIIAHGKVTDMENPILYGR